MERPRERRYAVIGGRAYYLSAHPTAEDHTLADIYAAYGSTLMASRRASRSKRYSVGCPGLSHGGEWSLPLRLGLTF